MQSGGGKKLAILIGNASYSRLEGSSTLRSPVNDIHRLARGLKANGFDTDTWENIGKSSMEENICALSKKLTQSPPTLLLVFFSGYAAFCGHHNAIFPTDASSASISHLLFSTIPVSSIIDACRHSLPDESVLMFLLDAHYRLPLSVSKHGGSKVKTPLIRFSPEDSKMKNIFVATSASDGDEPNEKDVDSDGCSLLPRTLALELEKGEKRTWEDIFLACKSMVNEKSKGKQNPTYAAYLSKSVVLERNVPEVRLRALSVTRDPVVHVSSTATSQSHPKKKEEEEEEDDDDDEEEENLERGKTSMPPKRERPARLFDDEDEEEEATANEKTAKQDEIKKASKDTDSSQFIPYATLRTDSGMEVPLFCDVTRREDYLNDKEFDEVFRMSKSAFAKLQKWKQNKLKREVLLF
eukprot:TRINITY_DN146_c2_g1_i1.p1 TRINITY_DN146_c2_g1~~TRINITY_DN146_c2_g1_i1.p1  ORF type:complete len:410 (-),score=141.55 TRINITY_DN146_c2_g1_i1:186-1415(-)